MNPVRGIISWSAMVTGATRRLKEAAGKALARRTEITYEAYRLDKRANFLKIRNLPRESVCICGGYKCEGINSLPEET